MRESQITPEIIGKQFTLQKCKHSYVNGTIVTVVELDAGFTRNSIECVSNSNSDDIFLVGPKNLKEIK